MLVDGQGQADQMAEGWYGNLKERNLSTIKVHIQSMDPAEQAIFTRKYYTL
jgi:hypothetical protein